MIRRSTIALGLLCVGAAPVSTPETKPATDSAHSAPAAAHAPSATIPEGTSEDGPSAPAHLLPFAAALAQTPAIDGPAAWHGEVGTAAWRTIAHAPREGLQAARWSFAVALIGQDRAGEALGVLDTMLLDDGDLALVANFQLARGVVLTLLHRHPEALAALAQPNLAANSEACLWRMRALSEADAATDAMAQMRCALPALNQRHGASRVPFLLDAAQAAIDAGNPAQALSWLGHLPDRDGTANVLRGRALLAQGDKVGARLRFERAEKDTDPETAAAARLGAIEAGIATGKLDPPKAIAALDALRFGWRGGAVEARALQLELSLADETHDLDAQLRAGATLFRYFPLGIKAAPMMARLQAALSAVLAPDSKMPLAKAAGIYWDYRELAPPGSEGDMLALRLAERMQTAGLYARAAGLLEYQLTRRASDVAQGPLSVKVAALRILSGEYEKALDTVRSTEQAGYTDAMRWDRKRMEAVALAHLGRKEAAIAALDGVPDADRVRAEIDWRAKDWGSFVSHSQPLLPAPKKLTEPARAVVLRHAIALAMLGREDRLEALGKRYSAAFKDQPGEEAFALLTASVGSVDPDKLSMAMAALPTASPPDAIGDLLDAGA